MAVEKFILSVLVNNEAGVLTRVSGLFARRSFNIDSLSVAETQDPRSPASPSPPPGTIT